MVASIQQSCFCVSLVLLPGTEKSSLLWTAWSSLDFGMYVTDIKVNKSRHNYTQHLF